MNWETPGRARALPSWLCSLGVCRLIFWRCVIAHPPLVRLVAWRDFVEDVEKAYPDKDDGWSESQVGRGDQYIPDDGSTIIGKL